MKIARASSVSVEEANPQELPQPPKLRKIYPLLSCTAPVID